MRVAALDLGSNTSLLLVAEVEEQRLKRVLSDETTITRLGQGVHASRRFHPEAMARMQACLANYQKKINDLECEKIVAVATSAARDVENGEELIKLGRRFGIPIHIISGQTEARLTFRGALCDRATSDGIAVIDVGGGSTEIITNQGGDIKGTSVDVGSVRLSEIFVKSDPISILERTQLKEYVLQALQRAPVPQAAIQEIVAVAGTPTTLAALDQQSEFKEEVIHGYHMPLPVIEQWIERLSLMPLAQREALTGMQPKRADVIVAGAIILSQAVRALGKSEVTVSTRGVRYGVALAWQDFF